MDWFRRRTMTKRKYKQDDKVYKDFLTDGKRKDMAYCDSCERWIPPSYYDEKGKPAYIHSCYNAAELRNAPKRLADCFHGGVDDLIFWTFRYFLGRCTISTCAFAEELAKAWPLLGGRQKDLIKKELEREFMRDDAERKLPKSKRGFRWLPLGHDCDRAAWQKVRDAYLKEG
jgi:hypothetical protein